MLYGGGCDGKGGKESVLCERGGAAGLGEQISGTEGGGSGDTSQHTHKPGATATLAISPFPFPSSCLAGVR